MELQRVVDYVRTRTPGTPAVDLARLNLLVSKPLSRNAMSINDDPELVERAWKHAHDIVGSYGTGAMK